MSKGMRLEITGSGRVEIYFQGDKCIELPRVEEDAAEKRRIELVRSLMDSLY